MLQKIRSSLLFQLICLVGLIFAVLFTTFHAAQAYVRRLSVRGAETLAESLVTQADDALMLYEQELRYYASGTLSFPVSGGLKKESGSGKDAAAEQLEEYFWDLQNSNQDILSMILFDGKMNEIASFGVRTELPEQQRYLREQEELNADRYFGEESDFYYAYYYPGYEKHRDGNFGMCVFILDRWALEGTIRNIIKDHSAALLLSDSKELDLAFYSSGTIPAGKRMEVLRQDPDIIYREGNWQQGIRSAAAVSVSGNAEGVRAAVNLFRFATIISAVLLGILLFFSYYQLARPIRKLTRFIDRAVTHPDDRLKMNRKDEIGVVAASLDHMLDENRKMIDQITRGKILLYEQKLARERMEILAYRNQINPHFLYNTLSCIRDMALFHDDDDIADITMALSDIFRYAVKGSNTVQVRDEVQYIQKYAKIMEYRFMGKIQIQTDVSEEAMDLPMIRFFLQPLVENSVLHGLGSSLERGFVNVGITVINDRMQIYVRDNGKGMDKETLERIKNQLDKPDKGTGIGMNNIIQRLRLFYRDDYSFTIESEEGKGTLIQISLPCRMAVEDAEKAEAAEKAAAAENAAAENAAAVGNAEAADNMEGSGIG